MINFSDSEKAKKLLNKIHENASTIDHIRLMEVCGTHTMEMGRIGLRSMLPENMELVSGPGCPVCVTPASIIDSACELALLTGCTILTFGDMVRVPGNNTSLEIAKSKGAEIKVLRSPLQAISIAHENPLKLHVFIAVGFETTAPVIARTVELTLEHGLNNLFFLTAHRIVPPALQILLYDNNLKIDGIILPGHVASICGIEPFKKVLKSKIPAAITGFDILDILLGISTIVEMLVRDDFDTLNVYRRVVKDEGNVIALQMIGRVFETTDAVWRGIGMIPQSGLSLRDEFRQFDAKVKFSIPDDTKEMPDGCACGNVLKGIIRPSQCPSFKKTCTPENPKGPCMVSSEGSCAAYYKYGDM